MRCATRSRRGRQSSYGPTTWRRLKQVAAAVVAAHRRRVEVFAVTAVCLNNDCGLGACACRSAGEFPFPQSVLQSFGHAPKTRRTGDVLSCLLVSAAAGSATAIECPRWCRHSLRLFAVRLPGNLAPPDDLRRRHDDRAAVLAGVPVASIRQFLDGGCAKPGQNM